MRNEWQDHEQNTFTNLGRRANDSRRRPDRPSAQRVAALEPCAVDAALADDSSLLVAQRGSRRELAAKSAAEESKRIVDEPHVLAGTERTSVLSNDPVLQRLSEQLNQLRVQQEQISRLLEQAEQGAPLSH